MPIAYKAIQKAALAAGIFHREEVPIEAGQEHMREKGIRKQLSECHSQAEMIGPRVLIPDLLWIRIIGNVDPDWADRQQILKTQTYTELEFTEKIIDRIIQQF